MDSTEAELSENPPSAERTGQALLKDTFEMVERAIIAGVLLTTASYLLKHPDSNPRFDQLAATAVLLLGWVLMVANIGAYFARLRRLGLPKFAWIPAWLAVLTISAAVISVAVRSSNGS